MTELRVVGGDLLPPPDERRHLLSIADLGRDDVERLLATARSFALSQERDNKKLPTLRGRLILNVFYESSTRTSSSFELAAKRLSADTLTLKAAGSSVDKGESLKDTALTLSAYEPDVIVLRHPEVGAAQYVARVTEARVVNAGDGKHQHPTQALLDLFTMREAFGRLDGLQVAIVGDVVHSRVARSLIQALRLVGADAILVGPPALLPPGLAETSHDIGAIADADVIYVLRMQQERMLAGANFVPSLARVHSAVGDHARSGSPGSARDASRPDEPRRRDRRTCRRFRRGPDRRPGAFRPDRADGSALRLADERPCRRRDRSGGRVMLVGRSGADDVVIRGARVLDPAEGVDATLDVRIDNGVIAQIGADLDANGHRVVDAAGLVLAPAFIDPHVHLRTPGREDEETLSTGTAAAAAGGYCAILAIPNTEPVVDDADVLRGLRARAATEAHVPVGFLAAITKGLDGAELTEMGALADAGAAGFTDDGRPVAAAGVMRRALQYNAITGRMIAVHCEEQSLTRGGHAHAGAVAAELGLGGWPSLGESLMVARDIDLAGDTGQAIHLMHLSARESVQHLRRAHEAGIRASGEATPHHLCLTDEAVRSLDPNVKMNPPLRTEDDRAALLDALRDGTIAAIATDHAPHSPEEKDVPFESAPFGVTGLETAFSALYTYLVEPGVLRLETILERMSAGPAAIFGLERPRIAVGAPANLTLLDTQASWRVKADTFKSRSANSWLLGKRLSGRVRLTIAAGQVVHQ